ncbi:hypothetical protein Tco_1028624 [Tanacetum coccineum]|uniref:Reverse transcriptase domain-containing protein n=1 Tax=Tanacetum coccineum TaxID=301880 RepID=A0ABQ5G2M0_9ASTR
MGVFRGVEKVRALGANGVAKGSTIGIVWFEVGGGMVSAKVVSMVVLGLSCECLGEDSLEDSIRVIRKRSLQVVEEALEQALSLFEFQGFFSFNGRKLIVSAMLLKKHPKKLGDPGKFLIPCNFPGIETGRALIDIYGEEITLRVDSKAVTFNLDQTTRYSSTNDKSVNRIDIIDAVCEEYAPELLGFPNSSGGNPTPTSKPFTSEFILEEIEAYLKDDSISPEIDHADCNPEEDICLIEKLLNNDPFQLPPMDLKQSEVTEAKSSIEEPPELELKDLPSHLEYAFLEENDKLPIIIAKGLKNDEKYALLKVLKSHKRVIAWKITDIKGEDEEASHSKIKTAFSNGDRVTSLTLSLKIFLIEIKNSLVRPFHHYHQSFIHTEPIELSQPDGLTTLAECHRWNHYFGGYLPTKEDHYHHTLPKDKRIQRNVIQGMSPPRLPKTKRSWEAPQCLFQFLILASMCVKELVLFRSL